jgi:hypothetical protein
LAKKLVNIRKNVPLEMRELYDEKANTLLGRYMKVGDPILRSGELFYTLTVIPTPDDAILDKKDYDEYVNEFFERADQPWDEI